MALFGNQQQGDLAEVSAVYDADHDFPGKGFDKFQISDFFGMLEDGVREASVGELVEGFEDILSMYGEGADKAGEAIFGLDTVSDVLREYDDLEASGEDDFEEAWKEDIVIGDIMSLVDQRSNDLEFAWDDVALWNIWCLDYGYNCPQNAYDALDALIELLTGRYKTYEELIDACY